MAKPMFPRAPYLRREDREAALPEGQTCGTCSNFAHCQFLHQAHELDEICDWIPIRFLKRLALTEDRNIEQLIADGDDDLPCVCGHARHDHYMGECRSYFTASDRKHYPCECNEFKRDLHGVAE